MQPGVAGTERGAFEPRRHEDTKECREVEAIMFDTAIAVGKYFVQQQQ
jgi:hypothetical protein